MEYQDYIDLGFTRTDVNDSVVFKQTGYYGFSLDKDLNDRICISVSSNELDKPVMLIKKGEGEQGQCHWVRIPVEVIEDLFYSKK